MRNRLQANLRSALLAISGAWLFAQAAFAGEVLPAEGGAAPANEAAATVQNVVSWTLSLDPFTLTLLFLVVATIVGTLLKGRSRDRCFKKMVGFDVRLVLDDRIVEGKLAVGNAGIETTPDNPEEGPFGQRIGFVLPKAEYGRLRAILRIPEQMDKACRRRRKRMLRRVLRPGTVRRIHRWASNLAGSFKDAFTEFFSLLMGRLNTNLSAVKGQQSYITRMQKDVAGVVPNTNYDAILEGLRGRQVEVELKLPDMPPRISAALDDYTAQNVSVFDARLPVGKAPVKAAEQDGKHVLKNDGDRPVMLGWGAWEEVAPGEEKVLGGPPPEGAKVFFVEVADVVFPRASAQIRYRLGGE